MNGYQGVTTTYLGYRLVLDDSQGYVEIWNDGAAIGRADDLAAARRLVDELADTHDRPETGPLVPDPADHPAHRGSMES